MSEMPRQVG